MIRLSRSRVVSSGQGQLAIQNHTGEIRLPRRQCLPRRECRFEVKWNTARPQSDETREDGLVKRLVRLFDALKLPAKLLLVGAGDVALLASDSQLAIKLLDPLLTFRHLAASQLVPSSELWQFWHSASYQSFPGWPSASWPA